MSVYTDEVAWGRGGQKAHKDEGLRQGEHRRLWSGWQLDHPYFRCALARRVQKGSYGAKA